MLASIARQEPFREEVELETWIIDNGSTDGTGERMDSWTSQWPLLHVHYMFLSQAGLINALNTGLKLVTGDYVFLTDSDDFWDPKKLRVQLGALLSNPGKRIAHTDLRMVSADGRCVINPSLHASSFHGIVSTRLEDVLHRTNVWAGTVLMARTCLGDIVPFPESLGSQDAWIALCGALEESLMVVPEVLYNYRYHGNNQTLSLIKQHRSSCDGLKDHIELLTQFTARFGDRLTRIQRSLVMYRLYWLHRELLALDPRAGSQPLVTPSGRVPLRERLRIRAGAAKRMFLARYLPPSQ